MRKPVTLIAGQFGSRHFGTQPYLGRGCTARRARKRRRALYIGAASGDDESFGTALCALIAAAGARGRRSGRSSRASGAATSGGAQSAGARGFRFRRRRRRRSRHGCLAPRETRCGPSARRRLAVSYLQECRPVRSCSASAGFAGRARTPATTRPRRTSAWALARCSLDTHGEGDDWREARSFVAVRARELEAQSQSLRRAERRRAGRQQRWQNARARRSPCPCSRRCRGEHADDRTDVASREE